MVSISTIVSTISGHREQCDRPCRLPIIYLGAFPVKVFRACAMIAIFGYGSTNPTSTGAIEIRFEAVGELLENSISSEPGAISDRMEHSTNYNGFNYQAALPSARFRPLGW